MRTSRQSVLMGILATTILLQSSTSFASRPYDGHVQCEGDTCKVDIFLIRGFRAFSQCQVCHGIDGNGSTIGPSLIAKLQEIDRTTFDDRVTNGFKGQTGVMPPWKTNPNVMKYLDNLYAYLMARSDKVIPAGRLQRFDHDGGGASATPKSDNRATSSVVSSTTSRAETQKIPSSSGVFGSRGNLRPSQ